jgi:hypothetical protein
MAIFRQKTFTEYDAMRSLYVELQRNTRDIPFSVIDEHSLLPVLKENSIVIERFVISTAFGHKDRYRMYIKIGAKAKMPDQVRLPGYTKMHKVGNLGMTLENAEWADPSIDQGNYNDKVGARNRGYQQKNKSLTSETPFSNGGLRIKLFGDDKFHPDLRATFSPNIDLNYETTELTGETLKYDKKERSLVLEFPSVQDAVRSLKILPFGLNYKVYLLNL